jgi:hypothetical protein
MKEKVLVEAKVSGDSSLCAEPGMSLYYQTSHTFPPNKSWFLLF